MRSQRAAISFAVVLAAILPDDGHGQNKQLTCQTANFSEAVRAKMPSVRRACLEIVQHDGASQAVLRGKVTRVSSEGVEVRFMMPDGTEGDRRFIEAKPGQDILVGDATLRVKDLAVGQLLTIYLNVTEPMVEFSQPSSEQPAAPVPLRESSPPAR